MVKKNGFVFVESVTILIIVVLALTLLISSYSLLVRRSKSKDYYNLPKDKYLLYNIGNLGERDVPYSVNTSFVATKDNCNTYMGNRISNCNRVFTDTNLLYYIVIYNIDNELKSSSATSKYDSPTIEYLKTLKKCKDTSCTSQYNYVVGVFKRDNNYYYVSLEL